MSADRHFLRFVRRRDADALAAVFDETAPGLLRLALHLTGDPVDAEDLVQTTFLAAIESAKAYDPARPVRLWLAGILANKARLRSRDRARRPDPGRLPRRTDGGTPDENAQERELDANVDRALNELEDPYRETLVLHLRYGLQPAEIADALGRSAVVVRTHLHRGRAMLRRLLPAGLLATVLGFAAAPRGLEAVRKAVLGGLVMKKKLGLAALIVALLSVATVVWHGVGTDGDASATRTARRAPEAAHAKPVETPPPAVEKAAVSVSGPRTGTLRIRAVVEDTDEEIPHAVVTLVPHTHLRSGAVHTCAPGEYRLHAGRRAVKVRVEAGRESIAVVRFPRGMTVRGSVVDGEGKPLPGATLHLSPATALFFAVPVAQADANGSFLLEHVRPGSMLAARAGHRGSSGMVQLYGKDGHETTAQLVVSGKGGAVTGTVVGPDGPLPGALVAVDHDAAAGGSRNDAAGNLVLRMPPAFLVRTGPDGKFRLGGIDAGAVTVTATSDALAPGQARVTIQHGTTTGVTVRLDRGRIVEGRVTGPDGAPASGASVALETKTPFAEQDSAADEDGRFRFDCVPSGDHTVAASLKAAKAKAKADGRFLELRLKAKDVIEGRVVDHTGRPLARWFVQTDDMQAQAWTARDGRFSLDGFSGRAPRRLRLFEKGMTFPTFEFDKAMPGAAPIEIRIPAKRRNTAWIAGRLAEAKSGKLRLTRTGERSSESRSIDTEFRIGPYPPGRYDVEVLIPGSAPVLLDARELQAGKTLDLGTLRGADPGRLRIGIDLPNGRSVTLLRNGKPWRDFPVHDRTVDSGPLPPGDYRIKVWQPGHAPILRDVRVVAGQKQTLELSVRPGVFRMLRFQPPEGSQNIAVRIYGPSGRLAAEYELGAPFGRSELLGKGRHVVEAVTDTGASVRREITIDAGTEPIEIAWS